MAYAFPSCDFGMSSFSQNVNFSLVIPSHFNGFHVVVSTLCCLLEFYPERVSLSCDIAMRIPHPIGDCSFQNWASPNLFWH